MNMDFDEYEYLEKAVENPEPEKAKKEKENGNGSVDPIKSEERNRSRSSKNRREEKADDLDDHHISKHLKSRDETSRDHDRHKERGSSHRRSRSREGEKDRHRSRRDHRGKDRDRDMDREERNVREREKERVRKDRDRESERDREREKEREREQPERETDKSHDREFKERENERESRGPDRQNRRYKEKKEDGAEPEVDPERDQRTVFAYQISLKATERDVYEFFVRAGKVRDVRLIMDRNSRRSKGVGYVEFYDVMSVPMAIALSGQPLLGQPVMVKPSEAEKNLVQSTTTVPTGQTGPYAAGGRRLYVGNLHFNITEEQLRQVFEAFGTVELVQLPFDETGHSKGFGFVQFGRLEDAKNALNLNGQLEIGGRVIKVSTVTDQGVLQDVGTNASELDDDDGGGFSLNSSSRALLMAKLDRSGTASSITASMGMPVNNSTGLTASTAPIIGVSPLLSSLVPPTISGFPGGLQLPTNGIPTIDTIGTPSECLLLKNMFDPTLETEPDFDIDIKEDVKEECTKFGNLKHIHVESDSAGFVYLRFEDTQGAINAQRNLHGRWFAGKMITATFMVPEIYEAKFPDISSR